MTSAAKEIPSLHGPVADEPPAPALSADEWAEAEFTPGRTAVLSAFADVAAALTKGQDLDTLLDLVASRLCALTSVRRCTVFLRHDESDQFHGKAGHTERGDLNASVRRLVSGTEADAFTREIVRTARPVFVADARRDARPVRAAMRRYDVRSILGVPLVMHGDVTGILYLDNEDQPHPFDHNTRTIALAFADLAALAIAQSQATAELRKNLATVARQNDVLRRATALDERLHELTLGGGSMQDIAAAIVEQSGGKPCAIFDADLRCLANVTSAVEDAPTIHLFDDGLRDQPAIQDALSDLAGSDRRPTIVGPFRDLGLGHRYLLAPVHHEQRLAGYVVVMEFASRLSALDVHIARRAATHVALDQAAERRVEASKWDGLAAIAGELIHGSGDGAPLRRRADFFGVDLDAAYAICLVSPDDDAEPLPGPRELSTALARAAGMNTVLTTTVAEGVIAIMPLPTGPTKSTGTPTARLKRTIQRGLTEFDASAGWHVAVSDPCTRPAEFRRGLDEAIQVLRCQQTLGGPASERVLAAADLGSGRVFLASVGRAEAERFADRALGALTKDGASGDLLDTLAAFFESGNSIRRAATLLDVHENTIRYRLTKIQEDTGLQIIGNADDQLTAHMALLIRRLQGVVEAPR